jgi:hypothetical protein
MINRREFLQVGIAAIPLVTLPSSAFAVEVAAVPLYKVIFDERFAASVAFAAEARRLGASVQAIRGDITDIWYNDLYHRWQQSPVAIAGLTTNRSLFCLDMFARDVWMRVVHHADHRILADSSVEHEVFGPEGVRQTAVLKRAGANWSAEAAKLVMRFPETGRRPVGKTADLLIPAKAPQPLVSWVIGPVKRA